MKNKPTSQTGRFTDCGYVSSDTKETKTPPYVIAELRYEAPLAAAPQGFVAAAEAKPQANALNEILSKHNAGAVRTHFGKMAAAPRDRMNVAHALPPEPQPKDYAKMGMDEEFIRSGFVQVVMKSDKDADALAQALNRQGVVWNAYAAPQPVPAMASGSSATSRNFEPAQGYLHAAPHGIGAAEVWSLDGAKGAGITVCDIEGAWNTAHEDLPPGIRLIGGTMINDLGWRDHGTAVLGEMVSKPSAVGTVGICYQAKAVVHSAVIGGVFNLASALANATAKLHPGDVILIELQAPGPNGKYVAMQYWDDVYSAIRTATAKGITVVEAAGNGDENFDLAIFKGTGLQKDSGAIVVGAGVPPTNHFDFDGFGPGQPAYSSLGVPRSRIFFSNYGKIVNVQAWGWHVATLGYGDAQGHASENRWYTLRFSGTSSASPIVTGAVACLQGRAKKKNGKPLTPEKVRDILVKTGTAQQAGPGVPLSQHIGSQPNLPLAMKAV